MIPSTRSRGRGLSMVEILIAITVLSLGLIPIYTSLVWGSRTAVSSRLVLMANQLARETIEELKQVPIPLQVEYLREFHQFRRVQGNLFEWVCRIRSERSGSDDPQDVLDVGMTYPEEYERFEMKIGFRYFEEGRFGRRTWKVGGRDHFADRARLIEIEIRWEEQGGRDEKPRPGLAKYHTMVVDQRAEPYDL